MPETLVDEKRAAYTNGGKNWQEGQPLALFIHGAGMSQSVWVLQSRALAHHGWNVASPDLPGHGRSEDLAGIATVEDYTAWLMAFMAALKVRRAVLIGHSMGAGIALTAAALNPESVAGLVLIGSRAEMRVSPSLLKDTKENPRRAAEFITAHSHDRIYQIGGAEQPGTWQMGSALALLRNCPERVLHRDFAAADAWKGHQYTAKVNCPALVITGEGDQMTPAIHGRELAEAIPGASFELVPGAGHMVMGEAPQQILKLIRSFLNTIPG